MGAFLATFSSVFGAVGANDNTAQSLGQPARLDPGQVIVSQQTTLSATELAKYQKLEQSAEKKTQRQAAGAGMDTSTMVIIGVLVVVVIVAAASGGGGSGGGGY